MKRDKASWDPEYLWDLYQTHTLDEVANLIGASSSGVGDYLKRHGYQLRTRLETLRLLGPRHHPPACRVCGILLEPWEIERYGDQCDDCANSRPFVVSED